MDFKVAIATRSGTRWLFLEVHKPVAIPTFVKLTEILIENLGGVFVWEKPPLSLPEGITLMNVNYGKTILPRRRKQHPASEPALAYSMMRVDRTGLPQATETKTTTSPQWPINLPETITRELNFPGTRQSLRSRRVLIYFFRIKLAVIKKTRKIRVKIFARISWP